MGDNRLTGFASAFDAMLERNRRRLNEKMPGGGAGGLSSGAAGARTALPARAAARIFPEPAPSGGARGLPVAGQSPLRNGDAGLRESEAVRRLNERFGDGWDYEIRERRREGDEMIVLCRVTVPEKELSKEQFGRARLRRPGESETIRGRANGIPFSIPSMPLYAAEPPGASANPEEEAFQEAVRNALARCAELM